MTILVAEDNRRMRDAIKRFVAEHVSGEHTFLDASDGAEAIALYDQFAPDWVLMDVRMKGMNGLAAARAIVEAHRDARIIILTSYDDADYRAAAKAAGTCGYVTKDHLPDLPPLMEKYHEPHARSSRPPFTTES